MKKEEECVTEMLTGGQIEPSDSPWSSPVVLVTKKDGGTRFCVDYRRLNDVTVKDACPLPWIDDTLDMLAGKQWFSTLDLASGYYQVSLSQEARVKTAFATHSGLFQFRVMPFGLCNVPATFERLMVPDCLKSVHQFLGFVIWIQSFVLCSHYTTWPSLA